MSCELSNIILSEQGRTYYKDEPGKAPHIVLDIPNTRSWVVGGSLIIHIGVGIEKDSSNVVKTTLQPPKLHRTSDRRYNKQRNANSLFGQEYITVIREEAEDGKYTIPICKALPLSRNFKGPIGDIPTMFLHVMNHDKTNHIYSKEFVTMSKRQPEVLNKLKRGSNAMQDGNGSKRQRRSEQIKQMVANHERLVAQYKESTKKCDNLQAQNNQMKILLRQLTDIANVGMQSKSQYDILKCFRIAIEAPANMHWMRDSNETNDVTSVTRRL